MTKNKGKGGKSKRKGKSDQQEENKRELLLKEPGQEYAKITKILGNCRAEVYCFDDVIRLSHFRGAFRKRVWIEMNDIVLVGLRDYENAKCDVIHKYLPEEIRHLSYLNEIPAKFITNTEEIFHDKRE